jgi:3-dehydroquinate synthase
MKISSHSKQYLVEIAGAAAIKEFLQKQHKLMVIDKNVFDLYKDSILKGLDGERIYLFDAVEENKNIESALSICKKMAEISFRRSDELISIGGGIVQDVTGFAANIYNRGVTWTFLPTTLLAQCDSCIGSKTSLNLFKFKNILGTFYPPDTIYICLDFIKTLTTDDFLSGLGEVAKFNIMSAANGIELLEKNMGKLLDREVDTLGIFVERSLEYKKSFIEEDEFDLNKRILLNFAHTFGHAFETVSNYHIPHGQAVTLGLILANNVSSGRNILDNALKDRIEKICLNLISVKLDRKWFDAGHIVEAMKKDKKRKTEKLAAVLFSSDMSLESVQDIEESEVETAMNKLQELLSKKLKTNLEKI